MPGAARVGRPWLDGGGGTSDAFGLLRLPTCGWRSRRAGRRGPALLVRVLRPVPAAVRAAAPVPAPPTHAATEDGEEHEYDQQEPQKAEEREEAKAEVAVVVAVIDHCPGARVGRDDFRGVPRDEGEHAHDRRDDQCRESPDPCETKRSIHIFRPPCCLALILGSTCEGHMNGPRGN